MQITPQRFTRVLPAIILALVVYILFVSLDIGKYRTHHLPDRVAQVTGEQSYLSDVSLYVSPSDEKWLLEKIDHAQSQIFVGVYTFTLPSLREALSRAQERGVVVRIILEKHPYEAATINRDTKKYLQQQGIGFHETDQFAFMHAKYAIIDDTWMIATANWTRSSFSKNREFFLTGDDPDILQSLIAIFQEDSVGERGISRDIRLLAGPTNATNRLVNTLQAAEKSIDIYVPSLSDEAIIDTLGEECHAGTTVRIILAHYAGEEKKDQSKYDSCFQIRLMEKRTLHAKVILVDRDRAFVGSFNFTTNSLTNNREMGLFLDGKVVSEIQTVFEKDWSESRVALGEK